jgi:hypothetical protein
MITLAQDRALEKLKRLKKSDIQNSTNISEKVFESEKQKAVSNLSKMTKEQILTLSKNTVTSIPGATLQGIMYVTFFTDYHKNTYDIAQFYR